MPKVNYKECITNKILISQDKQELKESHKWVLLKIIKLKQCKMDKYLINIITEILKWQDKWGNKAIKANNKE